MRKLVKKLIINGLWIGGVGRTGTWAMMFGLLLLTTIAEAQLTLKTNRHSAVYEATEAMQFEVNSPQSGAVSYTIKYDKFTTPLSQGTIQHVAGQSSFIPYQHNKSGVVLCVVRQNGDSTMAAASFAPYDIAPLEGEPNDFDAFWEGEKAKLTDLPLDPQLSLFSDNDYSTTYKIDLAHIDNRRIYGFITIPDGTGPFPAFVTFPPFGDLPNLVDPEIPIAERAGAITMAISIHNSPVDEVDPNAYQPDIIDDPAGNYYRYSLLAGIRAIDYIFSRSDFNGEDLGVLGVSQGGGLALMTAGLDQRIKLLACSNPSSCQHSGLAYDRPSSFPYYIFQSRILDGTPAHEEATIAATKYYDGVYFAKRFTGPTMFFVSLEDQTTPPETQFAAYNNLKGPKLLMYSRDLKHDQNPDEYWAGRYDFFRRYLPATLNAPWPWTPETTGYFTDAGTTQVIAEGEQAQLAGQLYINDELNPLDEVIWRLEEGPGTVTFSAPNEYNTTASFSQPGGYLLSFSAYDDQLQADAKFYRLTDYVRVMVMDPTPPSVNLTTASLEVNASFIVNINLSEPVQDMDLSDFDIDNGTAIALTGNNLSYNLEVQPTQFGVVQIQLPANQMIDLSGNPNLASNVLQVTYVNDPSATTDIYAPAWLKCYPNPATSDLWLDFEGSPDPIQSLRLFGADGQLIRNLELDMPIDQLHLPIADLETGLYWIVCQSSTNQLYYTRFLHFSH